MMGRTILIRVVWCIANQDYVLIFSTINEGSVEENLFLLAYGGWYWNSLTPLKKWTMKTGLQVSS